VELSAACTCGKTTAGRCHCTNPWPVATAPPPVASTSRPGNRFNGNLTSVAQRRRCRDSRYRAGFYEETWIKIPKALEWAVSPGQRFEFDPTPDGLLLRAVTA
jgi:hypothetical protein